MASSAGESLVALGLQSKVDHHDGVLLHDSDEQDNADQRNHTEFRARKDQGKQSAHARRGQ